MVHAVLLKFIYQTNRTEQTILLILSLIRIMITRDPRATLLIRETSTEINKHIWEKLCLYHAIDKGRKIRGLRFENWMVLICKTLNVHLAYLHIFFQLNQSFTSK